MKENDVLNQRIRNLERIFDKQADEASMAHPSPPLQSKAQGGPIGTPTVSEMTPSRGGAWHEHHGLRISNGGGTVSVYKARVRVRVRMEAEQSRYTRLA